MFMIKKITIFRIKVSHAETIAFFGLIFQ